jgi:cell shape-determining protein MreC
MRIIVIRISLIVAIIAGVTVIQFHVGQLKTKMTAMQNALTAETAAREKAEANFVNAREVANNTAIALKRTADALEAKTAESTAQRQEIAKLKEDAETLRKERNDAQAELSAYRVSMPTPEEVAKAAKKIKTLQDSLVASEEENALLGRRVKRLEGLLPKTEGNLPIALPAELNAKVLALDPKWGFVVLDAGEDKGILEHGELLVNRGGRLVAKVQVTRVEKNRSVANIVPGWELTQLMEGDLAIPAHPQL